jgi:hypothetical protein
MASSGRTDVGVSRAKSHLVAARRYAPPVMRDVSAVAAVSLETARAALRHGTRMFHLKPPVPRSTSDRRRDDTVVPFSQTPAVGTPCTGVAYRP